jgi:succinate dehydrogenase flavin-adding protein (antitoxin of CptAB toxin-antitoxin module)
MYQTQQQSHQSKTPDFLSKENLKDLFETLVENNFSDFTQIMKSQDTDLINKTFQLFCKKAVDFYHNHIQLLDN